MRHYVSNVVMLLKDCGYRWLYIFVAFDQQYFLLQNWSPEIPDILIFFLEVHQLEARWVLDITNGFREPLLIVLYIVWKSAMEMSRFGCWPWSFLHLEQPILKAWRQVLCKQTKVHFSLCYWQRVFVVRSFLNWFFMEFTIKSINDWC